jgi:hypothetical protein
MCVFRPIRYKDKGFCSKECYEASKIEIPKKIEIEPIKEEILTVETEPIEAEVFIEDEISENENEIEADDVEIEIYEEEIDDDGIHE